MKTTRTIQAHEQLKFFIFLCLFFLTGFLKLYGQCSLSAYPNSLSFAAIGETKSLTIYNGSDCPFRAGAPAFLEINISGNTLSVKLLDDYTGLPGATTNVEILLLHQSTGSVLLNIPVQITLAPPPLSGGTIQCSITNVAPGTSPGTISNASSPSGGTGNYTYQWQQSTNDGSSWTNIAGAATPSFTCPPLTFTTSFRRAVTSGTETVYSNVITIVVESVLPPASPSSNQNYILSKTMLDHTGTASFDQIDYFDGLGRPTETVLYKSSPGQKDIVTLQEYDAAGRPSSSYIPVPVSTATGEYVVPSTVKTTSGSFYGDAYAYDKTVYELSPLNRITDEYGPGAAWHTAGKSVKTGWLTNTSSGEFSCALYAVASGTSLKRNGLYSRGELFVTKTTDEDGHISYTFTDKLGQVVLERVMNGSAMNDTYYVYDDFGNLRYVLPPAASDALTATTTWADSHTVLVNHAYLYKYDHRNRCTRKVLPGCDSTSMRYDRADRLVFSQDGNRRAKGEWSFFFYDVFGRQTVSGIWKSASLPALDSLVVKTGYSGSGSLAGHTVNLTLPQMELMTVNYYDDHAFISGVSQLNYVTPPEGYGSRFSSAKGLLTGTRTYRLGDPSRYTVSAFYHDHRGRIVQTRSSNSLGGFDDEYFGYTFTGKVMQHQLVHSAPGKTTQTEVYAYDYGTPATNPTERLLAVTHKLNGSAAITLAQYTYDEVGRIGTKKLATETSSYSYNVRSWLTGIAGTRFNQTLAYNAAVNGITPTKELYNGNIGAMKWKAGDESTERGYKFTYDGLDRLTAATYGEGASLTSNLNRFNEVVTEYDKAGNIVSLQRQGKLDSGYGMMDSLAYTYTGNRLTRVTDAVTAPITYSNAFHFVDRANVANEYTYDLNGNATKDLNRNITSITYNALNLPGVITFANGNTITYGYDATGSKLSVAYTAGGTTTKTEYAGNKVYKNGTLSMILTEEGYITLSGSTPSYHYYLKDHQGNNRVVLNQSGTVEQVNHYYPFGGLFGEGIQTSNQPYKYNGKELDRELGLDMYDYGARHYDASLGKWLIPDPLVEKYYSISPYVYVANNPVNLIDPTGMSYDWVQDKENRIKWDQNATPDTEGYLGKTVYATNENGEFRYGDQYGNWHDSAPLGEVSAGGFQSSGRGPVISGMRNAAKGYDPGWIAGFNQFVDVGLTAINLTLTATTLAADAGSLGSGVRRALNTVDDAAKGSAQLWTSTSKMSSVKNAFGHWKKHGAEFPEFLNTKQYVEGAKDFMHNSPGGTLMKTRANGDILKYHPGTNTFGVMDATGVPRTMFRPTDGMKYWLGQ